MMNFFQRESRPKANKIQPSNEESSIDKSAETKITEEDVLTLLDSLFGPGGSKLDANDRGLYNEFKQNVAQVKTTHNDSAEELDPEKSQEIIDKMYQEQYEILQQLAQKKSVGNVRSI